MAVGEVDIRSGAETLPLLAMTVVLALAGMPGGCNLGQRGRIGG